MYDNQVLLEKKRKEKIEGFGDVAVKQQSHNGATVTCVGGRTTSPNGIGSGSLSGQRAELRFFF